MAAQARSGCLLPGLQGATRHCGHAAKTLPPPACTCAGGGYTCSLNKLVMFADQEKKAWNSTDCSSGMHTYPDLGSGSYEFKVVVRGQGMPVCVQSGVPPSMHVGLSGARCHAAERAGASCHNLTPVQGKAGATARQFFEVDADMPEGAPAPAPAACA